MDYATQWKALKEKELEAQKERRELEDKMLFEGYTDDRISVRPSVTKYFELSSDEYKVLEQQGYFEIEYRPNWKAIKENQDLLNQVQTKSGRATFIWKEKDNV